VPADHVLNVRPLIGEKNTYDKLTSGPKLTCDGAHFNREGNVKVADYIFEQF